MPLVQLSFTQLTDVSEIKSLGFPDDGEVTDGFSSDDQLGAFLSVRGEGVGQLKLESPIPELLSVADPLTWFITFTAAEASRKTDTEWHM